MPRLTAGPVRLTRCSAFAKNDISVVIPLSIDRKTPRLCDSTLYAARSLTDHNIYIT